MQCNINSFLISLCIKWTQTYAENQKVLIGCIHLQTYRICKRMCHVSDRFILHLRLHQTYASWSQTCVNPFILLEHISATFCLHMHTFVWSLNQALDMNISYQCYRLLASSLCWNIVESSMPASTREPTNQRSSIKTELGVSNPFSACVLLSQSTSPEAISSYVL